jgi:hypothetical protein
MKRPRVRISTLMLLVVIAGLVASLVVQGQRHAKVVAELKAVRFSHNARFDTRFAPAQ